MQKESCRWNRQMSLQCRWGQSLECYPLASLWVGFDFNYSEFAIIRQTMQPDVLSPILPCRALALSLLPGGRAISEEVKRRGRFENGTNHWLWATHWRSMRLIRKEKIFSITAVVKHWELRGITGRLFCCKRLAKPSLFSLGNFTKAD